MSLRLRGIEASHPAAARGVPALRGVDLELKPGEQVAVIGPSGAGKTTLLQVAAAALKPTAGSVSIDGVDPWSLGTRALQRQRGRLFLAPQTPPLPPRQRVVTAVLAGRLPAWGLLKSLRSLIHPVDADDAYAALQRFDIAEKLFDRVDRLSGGERQRVGLARALVAPATLWLIDEPLSALDPARSEQAISALLGVARERGVTLMATMHQVDVALAHFGRVVGLASGAVVFDLAAGEVTPAHLSRLYAQHDPQGAEVVHLPDPQPVALQCR